eukprot:CAMPEP_0173402300 /NCGR_PEP_ID=MMETSP1356-20130122/53469_1 /TAXON_ID=77927 ORGANISM="Hemiselmis virescens, Strain PCC157" /NCGR_SAMPLE_ID=MMETSP1356 /ASSEMBLY_ACC=CAM_ASM_000847 /LENGTH=43 /DNA_ID= /DNA_START= /DNA_END= /DNA_ORIENTATION=
MSTTSCSFLASTPNAYAVPPSAFMLLTRASSLAMLRCLRTTHT